MADLSAYDKDEALAENWISTEGRRDNPSTGKTGPPVRMALACLLLLSIPPTVKALAADRIL
jgi:hypothetical protein